MPLLPTLGLTTLFHVIFPHKIWPSVALGGRTSSTYGSGVLLGAPVMSWASRRSRSSSLRMCLHFEWGIRSLLFQPPMPIVVVVWGG